MKKLISAGLLLALVACTSPGPVATQGTWVGTITTEGNVTTVINESGSVWGGTATLVEEASIGVESGADEYMFGYIYSLYVTSDRVYVVDLDVPAVRAYDHKGTFVGNFGRPGQGPGEYTQPTIVAADESGRVFVFDNRAARINVYSPTGEYLETWPSAGPSCCVSRIFPLTGEALWTPVQESSVATGTRVGVQAVGPSGPYGDVMWAPAIDYERTTYDRPDGRKTDTPFSPRRLWSPAVDSKLVAGASDRYRFEVLSPGGSRLVVERYWDPVPIPVEQKEWERQKMIVFDREVNNDAVNLSVSQIPDHKPAYSWFVSAMSGETWLTRQGPSERLADCPGDPLDVGYIEARETPCWRNHLVIDAFGADGRYLGEVEVPEDLQPYAFGLSIDGPAVVGVAEDDAGTIMVKRYRLVLPGEEGQ